MGTYNLSEIMSRAHNTYNRRKGEMTFGECLKLSWQKAKLEVSLSGDYQKRVNEKYVADMKARFTNAPKATKCEKYNDLSIPSSAFYSPNSKGLMGAHYVGD